MADSDSIEQDSEPTPFLSRALIGRFLAVGLFLALGTFAVIQSISGGDEDPHADHDHPAVTESENQPEAKPVAFVAAVKPSSTSTTNSPVPKPSVNFGGTNKVIKPAVVVTPSSSPFSKTGSNPVSKPVNTPAKIARPTSGFSIGSQSQPKPRVASSFNKPSTLSPSASQGFGVIQRSAATTPSAAITKPGPQTRPAVTPKPPERLAQANSSGFAPKISSIGFGNPATSASRPSTNFGDSVNSVAKSAAAATSKSFGDLRSSVNSGAGALLAATKKTVDGAANAGTNAAVDLTKKTSSTLSNSFDQSNSFGRSGSTARTSGQASSPSFGKSDLTPQGSSSVAPSNPSAVLRPVQSSTSNNGGLRSFADRRSGAPTTPPATTKPGPTRSFSNSSRPVQSRPFGSAATTATRPQTARPQAARPQTARPQAALSQATRPLTNRPSSLASSARPALETTRSSSPRLPAQRNVSSSTQLNAQLASSLSAPILNTPGDRKLEGVQAPSLTIEKVSPREIQVNQSADFEIKVRNVGRVVANDVMVVDRVPSGTEFIGASPEPSKLDRGGDVQWTLGSIEPGQEKRIRFQLRPTQPGEIGSVAHVLFATQASMRTVVTKPVLDIVHSTRPRVLIGDNVVFEVIVENKGDGPATDVIVQEEVPDQLEYQEGFRQLEYEVGTLMPGQKRKIQLALRADKVGPFRNVVFVSGKGGLEAKHEIDVEVIAPEIKVTSDGPSRRFLQRQATHQFTIENRGTAEASNVNLIARLPSGVRYVSSDNRGRYDSNSHAVYWKMPSLKDGVAGTVELTTVPVEVGRQDIKFQANADLRLTAETTQEMSVEHLVDVHFEIDDVVDPIEVGTDTTYRLRILNQGTKVAGNVQLQVEFPRGLSPTDVDGDLRHQIQGQQVAFEPISSLPPGREVQLSIRARGNAPGDHRIIASIRSDGREVEVSKEETTRVYSDR